jgi:hypothetical protein
LSQLRATLTLETTRIFSSKTFDKDWTEEHRQLRAILTLETAHIFSTKNGAFFPTLQKGKKASGE